MGRRGSKIYSHTAVHGNMTHHSQKAEATQCPPVGEGYGHTMEYHSVLKRKGSLTHATTWVSPEDITLSEISPWQKGKHAPCEPAPVQDLVVRLGSGK